LGTETDKWLQQQVTLNEYQVNRGNYLSKVQGLSNTCRSVQADFMKLPFDKVRAPSQIPQILIESHELKSSSCVPCLQESYDGVYAIEATCHAPERRGVYGEIFRVLKPGAVFACYEWCLTDEYDKVTKICMCVRPPCGGT
jgi:sterol 24-C-methyltransferase